MLSFLLGVHLGMELVGYKVTILNLLKNYHTIFQDGWIILHFYPVVHITLIIFLPKIIFLIIAILVGISWYLTVVLIRVSLITSDTEHPFSWLLTTGMFSLKKCQFRSFA